MFCKHHYAVSRQQHGQNRQNLPSSRSSGSALPDFRSRYLQGSLNFRWRSWLVSPFRFLLRYFTSDKKKEYIKYVVISQTVGNRF
jgi:hypothetical protein